MFVRKHLSLLAVSLILLVLLHPSTSSPGLEILKVSAQRGMNKSETLFQLNTSGAFERTGEKSTPILGGGGATWNKTYGGDGDDIGRSIERADDGGYIVVGSTSSYGYGSSDLWVVKVDARGNIKWNKTLGGRGADAGYFIQKTRDGGYIIVGDTMSFGSGLTDIWLVKIDSSGKVEWNRTYGGKDDDFGRCVRQTKDGGYIIVGTTKSFGSGSADVWLIKTDAWGNMEWNRTFGGKGDDEGACVQQTSDGGYIVVGSTTSYGSGGTDVWLLKVDASGKLEWSKTYGGGGGEKGNYVQQTKDGGYVVVGETSSNRSGVWLFKTSANGNMIWSKTFGTGGDLYHGSYVLQTEDEGYVLLWNLGNSITGLEHVLLTKTDTYGNTEWDMNFGKEDFGYYFGHYFSYWGLSLQRTDDGGYLVVGYAMKYGLRTVDLLLVKFPPEPPPSNYSYPKYNFTVSTSGLEGHSTYVYLDGERLISIRSGENVTLALTGGHVVSVSRIVNASEGVRFVCSRPTVTVNSSGSTVFHYVKQYYLKVISVVNETIGEGWYDAGSWATISVTRTLVLGDNGERFIFTGWSGAAGTRNETVVTVIMDSPRVVYANWRRQFYVSIYSYYSPFEGQSGWYDEGSRLRLKLKETRVGFLIQKVFDHFEGLTHNDKLLGEGEAEILVDGPKMIRAVWRTDYTQLLLLSLTATIGGVTLYKISSRSKKANR